tara:strand:+ start:748 stop:960 length:213 start_codon:yes stop_codon:yes gene_type:complete
MNNLYNASVQHFKAQETAAIATIELYLTKPVAIGDHPNIIQEINEQVKKLSEARECLQILTQIVTNSEQE